ncbi:arf-GAP with dual PH domain-containing protein 1-like [Xenopus laevis]|uniref:Arf-GAP with dual PH domain-containing protein 1-like n=1 Tax=Xenopus laevis TaxID=8355 RepID=A0A8J1KJV4_XENLA|nr:arf-GAP with dual PH domain-containing protein 1-like [Xenopus laevis]XP_041417592.1 arf-GAP with dual PH domain-containing protein 1-like [Xenopus laevis]
MPKFRRLSSDLIPSDWPSSATCKLPFQKHLTKSKLMALKKRWFTLDHRRLMYFKDPLMSDFLELELWHLRNYGISVTTPGRTYILICESESEWENWLTVFKKVISQPMTVREFSG